MKPCTAPLAALSAAAALVATAPALAAGAGSASETVDAPRPKNEVSGGYAMDLPGFVEANEGFESSFRGAGAKLQLFLFDEQQGGFIGVDAGVNQLRVKETKTSTEATQLQLSTGVNLGWRFALPWNLYATPWLGVSYAFNSPDIQVAERAYHPQAVTFFPAVHLGYRFL